jgi:hypothetical protein
MFAMPDHKYSVHFDRQRNPPRHVQPATGKRALPEKVVKTRYSGYTAGAPQEEK